MTSADLILRARLVRSKIDQASVLKLLPGGGRMLRAPSFAAAMIAAIFIAPITLHSQTMNFPDTNAQTKVASAAYEPYALETVVVGSPENLHAMVCGLDIASQRVPEVACSNGEIIQFFRYAPMSAVWGVPAALVPATNRHQKCPKGYRRTKDDSGRFWCMDSEGRSYTPENARYVFQHKRPDQHK